eukprot:Gb_04640 [translate_table: standard]
MVGTWQLNRNPWLLQLSSKPGPAIRLLNTYDYYSLVVHRPRRKTIEFLTVVNALVYLVFSPVFVQINSVFWKRLRPYIYIYISWKVMRGLGVKPGWVMIICLILIMWEMSAVGEGARPAGGPALKGPECPLNVTALDPFPSMVHQCSQSDTAHCCEAIADFIKILLFSWLHTSQSFLLPNDQTAAVCLDAIEGHLKAHGGVNADKGMAQCKLRPQDFVSSSQSCNQVRDLRSFERAVDPSGMKQNCNGSMQGVFECNKCIKSMAMALNRLMAEKGSGQKTKCPLFVMIYVGGGINSYQDLGPDAAYCLMGAINLPALAPSAASWTFGQHRRRKRSRAIKIGFAIAVPALTVMLVFSVHACLRWRRLYRVGIRRVKLWRRHQLLRESVDAGTGLVFFGFAELKASTGNFSASNVIGEGGFSTIYKGTLPNGFQVAVKRFKDYPTRGDTDFRHEVQVISSVRHRNLLPLRGYCIGTNEEGFHEQLLVYDFMANGSLADYLFKSNRPCLSWSDRHKIAVGIARGLAYLHEDAKPAIIHRDIKAANVLLDADLNPLVADFGLAKFKQDEDKTHYTTRAVGTLGYVAPEYALYGHLTDKSDVFSFGILLLELMSGRKALGSVSGNVEHLLISDWACDLLQKGMPEMVIDKKIRDLGPKESMKRFILLALQCAHPRVACRPSFSHALTILEEIEHPLPEIISVSSTEMESEESSNTRRAEELNWLVYPDIEGRVSYGSLTLGNISTDSYWSGR